MRTNRTIHSNIISFGKLSKVLNPIRYQLDKSVTFGVESPILILILFRLLKFFFGFQRPMKTSAWRLYKNNFYYYLLLPTRPFYKSSGFYFREINPEFTISTHCKKRVIGSGWIVYRHIRAIARSVILRLRIAAKTKK